VGTVFPALESLYSAEFHDQVVIRAWDGTPIAVDVAMAPLLTRLWAAGYLTYFSCQGGEPCGNDLSAYIDFQTQRMAQRFAANYSADAGIVVDGTTVRFPPGDIAAVTEGCTLGPHLKGRPAHAERD
jgi:hypothetical protein